MDGPLQQWDSMATTKESLDLNGSILNVTAVIRQPPYASYKLDLELFKAIQFVLNFSYLMQKEDYWGKYDESTGKSTGMVRRILQDGTDLAMTAQAKAPVLYKVLDFTMTSYTFSFMAILQKRTFLGDPFALIRPFHWSLWLAVGLWCACVYVAFIAASYLSGLLMKTRMDPDNYCSIVPFSLLCGKSLPCKILATTWCRIIVCTGAMSALVLQAAFSALLLSFLFISEDNYSLSQLKYLVHFQFVIEQENYVLFHQKLKGALPSEFHTLYSHTNKVVRNSTDDLTSKVQILEGHWVALNGEWGTYASLNQVFDPSERCALTAAVLPMGKHQGGCMVPKKSKYKRSIDFAILKSREKGLLTLWEKRFRPQRPACPTGGGNYDAVPFECIYLAVCVFFFGLVCSVAILILEILSRRLRVRAIVQKKNPQIFLK